MTETISIHHPYCLKLYPVQSIGADHCYVDEEKTADRFNRYTKTVLPPLLRRVQKALQQTSPALRLAITGTAIELLRQHQPMLLDTLKDVVARKYVRLLPVSYFHSGRHHVPTEEYREQLALHKHLMEQTFGKKPEGTSRAGSGENETASPLLKKLIGLRKLVKANNDDEVLRTWRMLQDTCYHDPAYDDKRYLQNIITDLEVTAIMKSLSKSRNNRPQLLFLL